MALHPWLSSKYTLVTVIASHANKLQQLNLIASTLHFLRGVSEHMSVH